MENQKLLIVESPNKVKTITKFLDDSFVVMSSVGHIFKLKTTGEHGLGIDLENWEPQYAIESSKRKIVNELKRVAKKSSEIYVATDEDREGEAIAENIVEALKIKNNYKRIVFNEITKNAILDSIKSPLKLNEHLINAQKTRRMLDRIIGFRLSKLMKKKLKNFPTTPSAGRVQSIALKLIVDREKEIQAFNPVKYSTINALLESKENLKAKLNVSKNYVENKKTWIDCEHAKEIFQKLEQEKTLTVASKKTSTTKGRAALPLELDELIQKANSRFSMSASRITMAAQKLYEDGHITYPRTDSKRLSKYFLENASQFIQKRWGAEYLNESAIKRFASNVRTKGKVNSQDAHEAIRPTRIDRNLDQMGSILHDASQYNVYRIIYLQTLKALMNIPTYHSFSYTLENQGYKFKYNEKKVKFPGYLVLEPNKKDSIDLFDWQEGATVKVKFIKEDLQTLPPGRYSDGQLIGALKASGVGRPSTYGSTIKKIQDRKFVKKVINEVEQNDGTTKEITSSKLEPTKHGVILLDKLVEWFPRLINEKYTAEVESQLDEIANNKIEYKPALQEFYNRLDVVLDNIHKTQEITVLDFDKVGYDCPKCHSALIYRYAKRTGKKFIGCSAFPKCRTIFSTLEEAKLGKKIVKLVGLPCPKCGTGLVYKKSFRGNEFLSCPNYPKCVVAFDNKQEVVATQEIPKAFKICPTSRCNNLLLVQFTKSGKELIHCSKCKSKFKSLDSVKQTLEIPTRKRKCTLCKKPIIAYLDDDHKIKYYCSNRRCKFDGNL